MIQFSQHSLSASLSIRLHKALLNSERAEEFITELTKSLESVPPACYKLSDKKKKSIISSFSFLFSESIHAATNINQHTRDSAEFWGCVKGAA